MSTTVQQIPPTGGAAKPTVVRVGNASVRTITPGTVAIVSVPDGTCLNDLSLTTARDIHAALGQLLGVTA